MLAVCISVSSFVVQAFCGFEHDFSYGFAMKYMQKDQVVYRETEETESKTVSFNNYCKTMAISVVEESGAYRCSIIMHCLKT